MKYVNDLVADYIHDTLHHAKTLELLQMRLEPVEQEVDRLQSKIDEHINDAPTWHECVVTPILYDIKDKYIVNELQDRTILQYPVMLISPSTDARGPKSLVVLFRITDKTTGDFAVTITGYTTDRGTIERVVCSSNELTTEQIIKRIDKVRDQL